MSSERSNLDDLIGTSVSANKPKFTDIDPARLSAFIESQEDVHEPVEILAVQGGGAKAGASSGIVVFDARVNGRQARYVLRYAPMQQTGRIFAEYDVAGQFHLQQRLARAGVAAPNAYWLDADGTQLGLPGYVMAAVDGEVADGSPYTGGLIAAASAERRWTMFDEIFRALGTIHETDWQSLGLEAFTRTGAGRTPIERYLNWFWKTAEWVAPPDIARLAAVREWLIANQPDYHRDDYTLVHGDPGLGNYMFRNGRVVAILDWELAGIVHPSMDVAMQCSLNDFFRGAATPEIAARIPPTEEWIAGYERVTRRRVADFAYFRKLVTLPSLIVAQSMNRSMPDEMKSAHAALFEPMWAIAETR